MSLMHIQRNKKVYKGQMLLYLCLLIAFKENGKWRNYLYRFKGILDELKNIKVGEYRIKAIKIKKQEIERKRRNAIKGMRLELKIKSGQ